MRQLGALAQDPVFVLFFRRPFALAKQRGGGLGYTIRQGFHLTNAQRCRAIGGQKRRGHRQQFEVFGDHPRVVKDGTVFGHQHRDLGERIQLHHPTARLIRRIVNEFERDPLF